MCADNDRALLNERQITSRSSFRVHQAKSDSKRTRVLIQDFAGTTDGFYFDRISTIARARGPRNLVRSWRRADRVYIPGADN